MMLLFAMFAFAAAEKASKEPVGPARFFGHNPATSIFNQIQESGTLGPVGKADQFIGGGDSPPAVSPISGNIDMAVPPKRSIQPAEKSSWNSYKEYESYGGGKDPYRPPSQGPDYQRINNFSGELPRSYSQGAQALGPEKTQPDGRSTCFDKYSNSLVTNAQPYERRTIFQERAVTVAECEEFCLSSQCPTCAYRCYAFVFDRAHSVCDLFSHSGRAYPAQLRQYHSRDYYEVRRSCPRLPQITAPPDPYNSFGPSNGQACPLGTMSRFSQLSGIRAEGRSSEQPLEATRDSCLDLCSSKRNCRVVEYRNGKCLFFDRDELPQTGLESADSSLFLKLCLPRQYLTRCPSKPVLFERFPNKVLIGYADEVALDSKSEQDCIESCLKNPALRCQSIIYYKEAKQCIMNEETRQSQPQSFSSDKSEDVVYVDILCPRRRNLIFRDLPTEPSFPISLKQLQLSTDAEEKLEHFDSKTTKSSLLGAWTEWSQCDRSGGGRRIRYRECKRTILSRCPFQSEWCQ